MVKSYECEHLKRDVVEGWLTIPRDLAFDPRPGTIERFIPNNAYCHLPDHVRDEMLAQQNRMRFAFGFSPATVIDGYIVEYNVGDSYPFHNDIRTPKHTGKHYLTLVTLLTCPTAFGGGILKFEGGESISFPEAGWCTMFDGETHRHRLSKITRGTRVAVVTWAS